MPPKPGYRRGDIALILFPYADARAAKTRPMLVVQADALQTGLPCML
jgi:mRNA interferase MazF